MVNKSLARINPQALPNEGKLQEKSRFVNLRAAELREEVRKMDIVDKAHEDAAWKLKSDIDTEKRAAEGWKEYFIEEPRKAVQKIHAAFQGSIAALQEAKLILASKLSGWHRLEEEAATKKREIVLRQIEAKKISVEKGAEKLEKVAMPAKTVRMEGETRSFREDTKIFFISGNPLDLGTQNDWDKLPREFLYPNLSAIREAIRSGTKVNGVKTIVVKTPVTRTNFF